MLPDLEYIIGPQPPVAELPPRDAQRRFQLVFRSLLGVFARPEHPLALFLDDLQWVDAATLDLLEDLLTQRDLQHLLLIGAYRDDEVTPTHPLMRRMAAIPQAGGLVQVVVLKSLVLEDVGRIVADALHCGSARPLARLVHEKTAGNPFFAIQFLTALAEEGLLTFDRDAARWTWDLRRIRAKGHTDNVVDLLVGKLRRLPATTQAVLKRLACLGNSTPIATLALVQSGSENTLHATLSPAIRAGVLFRQEGTYKFLHDRVREAAYALIPDGERAEAHLTIGRCLAARTPPGVVEESIFELVGQLNCGAALIRSGKEREWLAELNLVAGLRAKASTAYSSALTYLTQGAALLPEDAWERRHDLAFSLELHRAECEFLTGVPTGAEARLAELSDRAAIPSELATLTRLRVDIFMTLGRSDRAVAVGLESLRRFNVTWAAHPTKKEVEDEYARLWRQLGDRPIEGLLDLPRMADPVACATMIVVASLVTPALWTDENLRCLVIGRMVNLSLEHGNSDASGYAYTAVGNVLGLYFGDYKAAFRFGQLGLDFVEQPGMDRLKARVYLAFGNLAKPPVRHARTSRPLARDAFEAAQQVGDITYAGISYNNLLTQLLASGAPLAEVHQEAKAGLDFARRAHFGAVVSLITAQLGLIRTLRGLTPVFGCFNDDGFEEEQFEQQLAPEPTLGIAAFMYWIRKLQARMLANDCVAAVAAATRAERLLWMSPVIFERADYHFYTALALAALCDAASDAASAQDRESLAAHHRQLQAWAEHCPENFVSRAALVGAEIARIEGRELDAEHLYEQATRSARSNGLLHIEAVAYERASAFYRARGFDEIAALYLQKARHCYLRWGADGKVRQLDELYPNLRTEGAAARPTGEIEAPIDQLDLATVVKVSQTVSSEIHLDKLIETLLKLALEHAGAERGLLILPQGEQHRIEAEITVGRGSRRAEDQVQVQLRHAPITSSELPQSVFRYVIRTQQKIILDDASANNMFSEDDYLRRRCPRSILCLPLIRQTKMVGVLYLENNLAPRVFTQKRLTMLELVASQAAISLDRARVHAELAQENAERKRTEEELRRSEAFLAQGQSISHTGSWRWHVATGTVHWSEETFRILGANPNTEKPAYSLFMERVHPEDRTRVEEILNRAVHDMSDFDFDCRIVLPNGSIKSLRSVGQPMVSSSGELEFIGTVMDITESKSAEAELRKQAQLLALAHDAIIVCDAQYRITFWNPGAVKTYGWTDEEAIGKVAPELLQTQFPVSLQAIKAALQEHGEWEGELRHITRQGSPIVVASRWSLRRGERGKETILEINRDITDHKRAEEAWREAQAQLAHVTRVVTLGELAGSIAHEVNQPLTAIINNADACLALLPGKISEGDDVREALSDIISDADRASAVLARIRGLIKKSPPQKSRLDLNETIGGVIALTRGQLDRNEVLLRTTLANDLPLIMGDRIQLQQVMLNLIINSIEAMSGLCDGPRELWITSEKVNVPRESEHLTPIRRDADRAYVLVSLADSGPALDANALDTLFDAFYTTKPHGLGMGLSISRSIIESHGGRLWAKANVPKGALFQFSLPIGAE